MPQFVGTGVPIKTKWFMQEDLKPCDVYLSGFVKEKSFPKKLASIMELWAVLFN
jgi:hypothetical protein